MWRITHTQREWMWNAHGCKPAHTYKHIKNAHTHNTCTKNEHCDGRIGPVRCSCHLINAYGCANVLYGDDDDDELRAIHTHKLTQQFWWDWYLWLSFHITNFIRLRIFRFTWILFCCSFSLRPFRHRHYQHVAFIWACIQCQAYAGLYTVRCHKNSVLRFICPISLIFFSFKNWTQSGQAKHVQICPIEPALRFTYVHENIRCF